MLLKVKNSPTIFVPSDLPRCGHDQQIMKITKWLLEVGTVQCRIQCGECKRSGRALPQKALGLYVDIDGLPNHIEVVDT